VNFLPFEFTLKFIELFSTGLFLISPILLFIAGLLCLVAKIISRIEKWQSFPKAIYFTILTALNVGSSNTAPNTSRGRFLSVLSVFIGVVLTGLIVSVALNAVMISWQTTHNAPMENSIEIELESVEGAIFHKRFNSLH
jgi:hypothetical protein